MALKLSPHRRRRNNNASAVGDASWQNKTFSIWEQPGWLLRIALILILIVLAFQMKLLNKVNGLTKNIGFLNDENVEKSHQPPLKDQTRKEKYSNCPFRESSLVDSVYVYPVPNTTDFSGDILSSYAHQNTVAEYPWVSVDAQSKREGWGPYDASSQLMQYNTELLVRDILTHPDSCLRTYDPEKATLFYVPYLPAAEFHQGKLHLGDYSTSRYGQAIMDILQEQKYDGWETSFGLTSKYWKRRGGSDHILVFSEPMHGLWHPRNKRGNYHFIYSQFQLKPPIVVSVELSTTFVDSYPNCARKNILMPYPNTDGKWFNGKLNQEAYKNLVNIGIQNISGSPAALTSEMALEEQLAKRKSSTKEIDWSVTTPPRVMGQFYKAGNHGTCKYLRESMALDFKCTPSGKFSAQHKLSNYAFGYREATFCPCPGGDSPSAKRMFDALLAGCIPVILSHDFVWPFTAEFDRKASNVPMMSNTSATLKIDLGLNDAAVQLFGESFRSRELELPKVALLNPQDYSIRLQASDHNERKLDPKTCERMKEGKGVDQEDLQSVFEAISEEELLRLKRGVKLAGYAYGYYQMRPDLPDNPLREGVLPDGGAAHMLVRALEDRAEGKLWLGCEHEMRGKDPQRDRIYKFVC